MKATPQQIKKLHTLLQLVPGMDAEEREAYKREQVAIFTDGRETSTTKLRVAEAGAFILALEAAVPQRQLPKDAADRMRKKIIYYAHEMGWELPSNGPRAPADMARINGWCLKSSYLHKPLNNYTAEELPALVTQFEAVYRSFINGLNK